jgi:hypothetical protein
MCFGTCSLVQSESAIPALAARSAGTSTCQAKLDIETLMIGMPMNNSLHADEEQ